MLHTRSTPDSGEYPTKGLTKEDTMKLTINIDDSMNVTVTRPCDACGVMVPNDEYCGDEGQYLCPDCYSQQLADRKYIHDWLIVLVDFDWTTDVRVAIHKEVATAKTIDIADCSSPDPDDDISRFGPGTSAHTLGMDDIDGLHADVNTVYCLVDSGLIDGETAPTIFKAQGGAQTSIKFCECDEPENETFDGGRTVRCVICGGE